MQKMSNAVSQPVVESTVDDKEVVIIASEIGAVLNKYISAGQIKKLVPDLCQAILRGKERYAAWKTADPTL